VLVQRQDVEFAAERGVTLRGWVFMPDGPPPHPAITMANGFAGAKEHGLEHFATAPTQLPPWSHPSGLLPVRSVVVAAAGGLQGSAKVLLSSTALEHLKHPLTLIRRRPEE
jgi:hypothetical protein